LSQCGNAATNDSISLSCGKVKQNGYYLLLTEKKYILILTSFALAALSLLLLFPFPREDGMTPPYIEQRQDR